MTTDQQAFHVDLRGMVDLLSHHLYSSPRVYLRELVQNAVDAITAREQLEPGAPRRIHVVPADLSGDGRLHLSDTGCGLDESGIRQVLATIGGSTKRDELGFARESFLGQFGIGLLSCFMVSDEIAVTTRRFDGTHTWLWRGFADGTYRVVPSAEVRDEVGTTVSLRPAGHHQALLGHELVRDLLVEFADHLPVEITVDTPHGLVRLGGRAFPWDGASTGVQRRAAAISFAERHLRFTPLDVVEIADVESGIRGMAFITPFATGSHRAHRVYAKGMLVTESEDGVLPEWAFFARVALNTDRLSLTASRESLHDDEHLRDAAERLGRQLRSWLLRVARTDPTRMREFLKVHHLGAKAIASDDPEMLDLVADLLSWQTTVGDLPLREFAAREQVIQYVTSVADFQQVSAIAQAMDIPILNAGYAYDDAIIANWLRQHPENDARVVQPQHLAASFDDVDGHERARFEPLVCVARDALDRAGCQPMVKVFEPSSLHAIYLADRSSLSELDRADTREAAPGPWGDALDAIARPDVRPAFVLNAANPGIRRLASADGGLQRMAVEALYAHALMASHQPLRPFDTALVARALPALIDRAIDGAQP